jgi:hypothetical protein
LTLQCATLVSHVKLESRWSSALLIKADMLQCFVDF